MGRDAETGQFRPGESGNPGGRPGAATARTLGGRRARRALLEVLTAIGPGLSVIVLDARGLVVDATGARWAGLDGGDLGGELGGEDAPAGPDAAEIAAARASIALEARALAQLEAEGWCEQVERRPSTAGGQGFETVSTFCGPAGQRFGWMAWRDVVKARCGALAVSDAVAAGPA